MIMVAISLTAQLSAPMECLNAQWDKLNQAYDPLTV